MRQLPDFTCTNDADINLSHDEAAPEPARHLTDSVPRPKEDARKLGSSYLFGLDGLRAIAVFAVLLYHVAPNRFVGGYVGVDFFFVISGFLITYRILQKTKNPDSPFSLKDFWLRRVRRLMPALVLLVLVCLPLAALIYPELLVGWQRQVVGALTYLTNCIEIFHGSNYFDQATPMLLKNLWSVAVEEQFYLVWPPILLLLLKIRGKHRHSVMMGVVGALALGSLALMGALASPENYTRVYYGTDTHCFGLALGILLALMWDKESGPLSRPWLSSQRWTWVLAPIGLAGFAALVCLVPDTSSFTYPFGLLLGSLCSLLLVGSVVIRPTARFTRVMEFAPMRWMGTRSYGIYLWHWPLIVFARILFPTAVDTLESLGVDIAAVIVSLGIAELSYRYVEEPIRRDGIMGSFAKLGERIRTGWVGRLQLVTGMALVAAAVVSIVKAPSKTQLQLQVESLQAETEGSLDGQEDTRNGLSTQFVVMDKPAPQGEGGGAAQAGQEKPHGDTSKIPNYDAEQMTGVPSGSTVTAIGDSLISGTSSGFSTELEGINFLAKPIRQWDDAVEVVNKGLEEGTIRQNVILDFGTNAGVWDEKLVYQVIDALGPERRILLYNIYSPSTFVDDSNAVYARIAEEYPNVYLVDWWSVAREHPEYLGADRTHPNMTGMYAFVDVALEVFSES